MDYVPIDMCVCWKTDATEVISAHIHWLIYTEQNILGIMNIFDDIFYEMCGQSSPLQIIFPQNVHDPLHF